MRITIEIDTNDLGDRDRAVLAAISGGQNVAAPFAASDAEPASDTSAGATPATATTAESKPRGGRAAKKAEAAASTPASSTSPGDVFSAPAASAPTAGATPLTGDVFSGQIKAAVAATEGGVTKDQVSARVTELLPTLQAKGLKEILGKFTKSDGSPVGVLRDLEEKDFAAFMDELSVY